MEEKVNQEVNQNSNNVVNNNEQPQMGVLANQSAAQPVQDVTASVNTKKNVQPQNPFILSVPAIPTQTGPNSG